MFVMFNAGVITACLSSYAPMGLHRLVIYRAKVENGRVLSVGGDKVAFRPKLSIRDDIMPNFPILPSTFHHLIATGAKSFEMAVLPH